MESKIIEKGEGLLGSWMDILFFDFIEYAPMSHSFFGVFFHSIPSILHFCLFMFQRMENKTYLWFIDFVFCPSTST